MSEDADRGVMSEVPGQPRPETISEATERRLSQVEGMVAEARWLIGEGCVPFQRELDLVRHADAALYDVVTLLRSQSERPR